MAHERKANESTSPVAKGMRSPIPAGKKDDLEDVSWALSTAEAMWGRGDHADGLKWLRRAAESAAEAEQDDRALELAKAAADVASLLAENRAAEIRANENRSEPRPQPPPLPVGMPALPAVTVAPIITTPSSPPTSLAPRTTPVPPPFRPIGGQGNAPTPPRVNAMVSPYPRPGQKTPSPPRVAQPAPISRRGGRKSSPGIEEAAQLQRGNRVSTTNEAKKRNRASKPSPDETAPVTTPIPSVTATAPFPAMNEGSPAWRGHELAGQQLGGHDLDDDDDDQFTRIGTPAYTESAQKASARPPAPPPAAGVAAPAPVVPKPPPPPAIAIQSSQALRVVVWRAADGVHVAPAGTTVAAISVEAFLVALDPTADLTAWLTNK